MYARDVSSLAQRLTTEAETMKQTKAIKQATMRSRATGSSTMPMRTSLAVTDRPMCLGGGGGGSGGMRQRAAEAAAGRAGRRAERESETRRKRS